MFSRRSGTENDINILEKDKMSTTRHEYLYGISPQKTYCKLNFIKTRIDSYFEFALHPSISESISCGIILVPSEKW